MNQYSISAIILAKNEEKNIKGAIKSVHFCKEIIVIDDNSTDKTIEQIQSLKSKVDGLKMYQRSLKGDFAGQRNYAMTLASNEWILFIDADEEVTEELKKEIIKYLQFSNLTMKQSFYIKRRDFWWGKELKFGETQKIRNIGIIRLILKGSGTWMGNVHEIFYTAKSAGTLNGFLNHYPHPTVKDFLQDINNYSTLRAKELLNQGVSANILQIVFFPLFKFILNYFIYLGFLDGPAGFAYAFFMSFHSFLVRAKLYQYQHVH